MTTTTSTTSLASLPSLESSEVESSLTISNTTRSSTDSHSSDSENNININKNIIINELKEGENVYDINLERSKLDDVIDIALLEVDLKTGKEVSESGHKWTVHNTRDKNVSVIYRKLDNDGMITMRSCMDIECNINDVYDFFDCEANDDLKLAIKNDKFMTSYKVSKVYDNDRCLVHTTFSTGAPKAVVKPRDFFYMKRRFKFDNYNSSSKKIDGILGYSVDSTHPEYVETVNKHVRGWIHYTGVIVIKKSETVCTLCYVVCVDLCGKLPKKIVNFATPQQGMNIKKFAANIDEARAMLTRRKSKCT